jgi:hypothetical protein
MIEDYEANPSSRQGDERWGQSRASSRNIANLKAAAERLRTPPGMMRECLG